MSTQTAPSPMGIDHDTRATARPSWLRRLFGSNATWVALLDISLVLLFGLLSPGNVFLSIENLQNQLLNGSQALLLALAMTALLGAALFDLSLGANLVVSSVFGAKVIMQTAGVTLSASGVNEFSHPGVGIVLAAVTCLFAGLVFGLVNGLLIAYLNINSLIATLGTLSIGTGLALILTDGSDIGGLPPQIQADFGLAKLFGIIPLPAAVALAAVVIMGLVFRYTEFGTNTLAIGSSSLAAERAGLKVRTQTLKLAGIAGLLAGIAGFISLSEYAATTTQGHLSDPLAAVTAAVIGGTSLAGGRVSILGTIWGTALAGILLGGLVTIGVLSYYQLVAIGSVLIVAVAIDQFRQRGRARG
jgi:ribose transport system permease protein